MSIFKKILHSWGDDKTKSGVSPGRGAAPKVIDKTEASSELNRITMLPEIDYTFSHVQGNIGKELYTLWEQYKSSLNDPTSSTMCDEYFDIFLNYFVSIYSVEVVSGAHSTSGHPIEVIVELARHLLGYITVALPSTFPQEEDDACAIGRSMAISNISVMPIETNRTVILSESDRLSISPGESSMSVAEEVEMLRCSMSYNDIAREEHSKRIASQTRFHGILQMLSVLSYWRHNRVIMQHKLGDHFAGLIVGLIQYFLVHLEDMNSFWLQVREMNHNIAMTVTTDQGEDDFYVLRIFLTLARVLSRSCQSCSIISESTSYGFLSPQPWEERVLQNMFDLSCSVECITQCDIDTICSALQPLTTLASDETWSKMLLESGADVAMISLLRKLHVFMQSLIAILTTDEAKDNQCYYCQAQLNYKACLVLQNEVLFALLCFMSSHSSLALERFYLHDGVVVLNNILLEYTLPTLSEMNKDLVFHRGYLCLRISELISGIRDISTTNGSLENGESCLLICESIEWLFSFIRTSYPYEVNGESNAFPGNSSSRVVFQRSFSSIFESPSSGDLWPWIESRESSVMERNRKQDLYYLCWTDNGNCGDEVLAWTSYTENAYRVRSKEQYVSLRPDTMPWYLKGKAACAWLIVYSILLNSICADDSAQAHRKSDPLLAAMLDSLCSRRPLNSAANPNEIPLFQIHFLFFISRCLHRNAVAVIEWCQNSPELWNVLFGDYFLLGGHSKVSDFIFEAVDCSIREATLQTSFEWHVPTNRMLSHAEVQGLAWLHVHDISLNIAKMLVTTSFRPPFSIMGLQCFEINVVLSALQKSHSLADDVSYQLLHWIMWYYEATARKDSVLADNLGYKFVKFALSICGHHLSDIGLISMVQKSKKNIIFDIAKKRPLMPRARMVALDLVLLIVEDSRCDSWLTLFTKNQSTMEKHELQGLSTPRRERTEFSTDIDLSNSATKSTGPRIQRSPAHATLVLLLGDKACREVVMYIIIIVVKKATMVSLKHDHSRKNVMETKSLNARRTSIVEFSQNKISTQSSQNSTSTHIVRKEKTTITDIVLDLCEHIKYGSIQPAWFDGYDLSMRVMRHVLTLLRQNNRIPMKSLRCQLNAPSLVADILSTLLRTLLAPNSSWDAEQKINVLHQGMALLTALMSEDDRAKSEFHAVMMARRSSPTLPPQPAVQLFSTSASQGNMYNTRMGELISLIIALSSHNVSLETILVLIDMMFDAPVLNNKDILARYQIDEVSLRFGFFANKYDRPKICNIYVVPIIFELIPHCSVELQKCIIVSFHSLISGRASLINMSTCSQMQPSLLDLILDVFPKVTDPVQLYAVRALQCLGKHSVHVAQLKRIFRMMQSKGDARPSYTWRLLQALQGMLADAEGPRHSFVFGGRNSGLLLPDIPKWPAQHEFTFTVWFNVESPLSHDARNNEKVYQPYILSFRTTMGTGVEIFLRKTGASSNKFRLHINSYHTITSIPEPFIFPTTVTEGRWYFLAVSFQNASAFRNKDSLAVMLDCQYIRSSYHFPKLNDCIPYPLLGDCVDAFRDSNINTTMRGQISSVYFFSTALSEGHLLGIRSLGPSYFYCFEPYSTVHRDLPFNEKQAVDPISTVLDGTLSASIILAYNPAVWSGDLYLDNTPEKNSIKWKRSTILSTETLPAHDEDNSSFSGRRIDAIHMKSIMSRPSHSSGRMHAKALPGTYHSHTLDVRVALNSLGGVKVLLPLFAQLDQPRNVTTPRDLNEGTDDVDASVDTQLCTVVLELLITLLGNTTENQRLSKDMYSATMIGYFLERISPAHMTEETLKLIILLRQTVSWSQTLSENILESVILNFRIWMFTAFRVQKVLLDEIYSRVVENPVFMKSFISVQKLVDVLYLLYDYNLPSISTTSCDDNNEESWKSLIHDAAFLQESWKMPTTKKIEGTRLKGEELQLVRSSLLKILENLILKGSKDKRPNVVDIQLVVSYAITALSPRSTVEMLSLILRMLCTPEKDAMYICPAVIYAVAHGGGFFSLLQLLDNNDPSVRLTAMILMCSVIHYSTKYSHIIVLKDSTCPRDMTESGLSCREIYVAGGFGEFSHPQNDPGEDSLTTPDMSYTGSRLRSDSERIDTLSALGVTMSSLTTFLNQAQQRLATSITLDISSAESKQIQCKLIAQSMQLTLLGEPCDYLLNIWTDAINRESEPLESQLSSVLDPLDSVLPDKSNEFSTVIGSHCANNRRLTDSIVCVPMMFVCLLHFINSDVVPVSLRLSVMVNLRALISQNADNCDRILRIPAWQDSFFQLLIGEDNRRRKLIEAGSTADVKKLLMKTNAVFDTCLRTLCDIQFMAVRIGRPSGAAFLTFPNDGKYFPLTVKKIFKEISKGYRQLGVSVLRETMSYLRIYCCEVNFDLQQTGLMLLRHTVNALQKERDTLVGEKKLHDDVADGLKIYFKKILHLNIWLIAAIILEFITTPLVRRISRDENICFPVSAGLRMDVDTSMDDIASHRYAEDDADIASRNFVYNDMVWDLVRSLIDLVGPMDHCDTWLFEDREFRLQTATQMGIITSARILAHVNENVNMIIPHTTTTSGFTTPSKVNNKTPLSYAAGGVCWVMVRILCSVFTQGGMLCDNANLKPDRSLQALQQLKLLLASLEQNEVECYAFEAMNVIARLTVALQSTTLTANNEWVCNALKFIMEIIPPQRTILLALLTSVHLTDESHSPDQHTSMSILTQLSRYNTATADDLIQTPSFGNTPSRVKATDESTGEGNRSSYEVAEYLRVLEKCSTEDANVADISMEAIRAALCVPDSFELDWRDWIYALHPIIEEADRMDDSCLRDRLTEMGLHKHSEEVRKQLELQQHTERRQTQEIAKTASFAISNHFGKRAKFDHDYILHYDMYSRRMLTRWNKIVSDLANERGPWGYGVEEGRDVFWMQGFCETDLRTRPLLRRNEYGTRHQVASMIAKGRMDDNTVEDSKEDCAPFTKPQGLWKDIMKYQKQDSVQEKFDGDRADGDDEFGDTAGDIKHADIAAGDSIKILFQAPVCIITPSTNSTSGGSVGMLELTKTRMMFTRSNENEVYSFVNRTPNSEFMWACQNYSSTTWGAHEIYAMYHRHYQMQFIAIEVFLTSRTSIFINFYDYNTARRFYDTVRRQVKPPYILPHIGRRPKSIISRMINGQTGKHITQAWINREISNFEYLMILNTVAGRTYNDLSQYPVFPWVLSDYSSNKLNLSDRSVFRDLHWSMGAQDPDQRACFIEKYNDLKESFDAEMTSENSTYRGDALPPFHYGSHYSCMGFVLWYLLRHEPFTSLNVWLQDGKFDKSDRLFDTIEATYKGCTSNMSDVKELIPEFFYLPDFLENYNNLDLGVTQNRKHLGHVGLPPWAKSPSDFIRIHRLALESEYVSHNLHNWIDLIFGYKQRPPHMGGSQASVDACNVYFHLTYQGAVNLEELKLKDHGLYSQTVRQIDNFGQTPSQLFDDPHPPRKGIDEVDIFWPIASAVHGIDTLLKGMLPPERPRCVVCFKGYKASIWPILAIGECVDRLITIDSSRIIAAHFWQVKSPDVVPPFVFKPDMHALRYSQGENIPSAGMFPVFSSAYGTTNRERRAGVPFAPHQLLFEESACDGPNRQVRLTTSNKVLYEKEESSRSLQRGRPPQNTREKNSRTPRKSIAQQTDVVVNRVDEYIPSHVYAILPESRIVFSCGHWDNALKATSIDSGKLLQSVSLHRDLVTCIALARDVGQIWLVSGSRDCTLIVWEIFPDRDLPISLHPLHTLYGHDKSVSCVSVKPELDVVVSGSNDGTLIVHSLRDGSYIRSIYISSPTGDPFISAGGSVSSVRSLHWVDVSTEGYILTYSGGDQTMFTYTLNGRLIASRNTGERLYAFRLSEDNRVIVTGGERALIVLRWVHSLELSNAGSRWDFDAVLDGSNDDDSVDPFNSPIRSIYLTVQERHLIVGLESGEVRILAQDSDYLRKRLHSKLMEIGILENVNVAL